MGVSSSFPLDVRSGRFTVYDIPFFASPLSSPDQNKLLRFGLLLFYSISIALYSCWLFLLTLIICRVKNVRIIHAHNTPDLTGLISFMVSRIVGIPYVYEVHDLTPELYSETMNLQPGSSLFKFLKGIESIAIVNSVGNVFVSEEMRRHFESTYKLDPSKSVVLYSSWSKNFMDVYKYKKTELHRLLKMNALDNKFKILYLGSMEDGFRRGLDIPVKSLEYLVHTCRLDRAALIYVGDGGGMIGKLSGLAQEYEISDHVSFRGMLPRYEAYKWLTIADVVVDPLRRAASTEIAVSNKVLEYMAAGKTIVASDLAGHREVLTDGYNGLLFRTDDSVDLANKLCRLAETADEKSVKEFGLRARKDFLEKYCWEMQQQKLLDLYERVLV
jgi:glycosyltransferase involved in cell wall biosynthesis